MKLKTPSLLTSCLLCSFLTFAQTTILTTDGKTSLASTLKIDDNNLGIMVNGEGQNVLKANVLAVIPEGKPAFTFNVKKGKKISIKKKDIYYNYTGTDKLRILAYKYQRSPSNISQLYVLNSGMSMAEEQFTNIFNKQQKKITNRNTLGLVIPIAAVIIAAVSLKNTMNQADSLESFSY